MPDSEIYTNPPEWNEPGTEPTQQKKDNGWQPGERPPAPWLNWWMHRVYRSLLQIRDAFVGHRDATSGVHGIPEGQSVATTQDIATAVDPLAQGLAAHENRTDNPHGVTKAQVGLSNVDNAKQATKTEFDAHVADKNNPHGVTKAQVGLSNVDNVKQAPKAEFDAHVGKALGQADSHPMPTAADVGAATEQYVDNKVASKPELRTSRFIVGTSESGWTAKDVDYLCDGVDDQVEINAAIQALPAGGGEIVILDGTYNIEAKIHVDKNNVRLRGNGNATVLKRMYNSGVQEGVVTLDGVSGCKIEGLFVDGNSSEYGAFYNYGIHLTSSSDSAITGNTCKNNFLGINLTSSIDNAIIGNTCKSDTFGIHLNASSYNAITGNTCNDNRNYGILLNSSSDNNVVVGNNSRSGINDDGEGNVVEANKGE